jgi:primosomal protein N' (replication factor Y)
VPVPLGQVFTYAVNTELAGEVRRGARVLCELGKRKVLGVVLDVGEREPDIASDRIKPVLGVVETEPVLPEELLGFLQELARYYVAPMGEVMQLALPAVERSAAQATLALPATRTVGKLVQVASALPDAPEPSGGGRGRELIAFL